MSVLRLRSTSHGCWRSLATSAPTTYVPDHEVATSAEVKQLEQLVRQSASVLVLTGAGISTEAGLPDYRSARVGLYARINHKPITIQEFVKDKERRQAYWARNFIAWPAFSSCQPTAAHKTLSQWQSDGKVSRIITQNVDRLHHKAGSTDAIELHGNGYSVHCLNCSYTVARDDLQEQLSRSNAEWLVKRRDRSSSSVIKPDGDVSLKEEETRDFQVPVCPSCGGLLKPAIVFFGENVRRSVVEECYDLTDETSLLLVVGSSLEVYSGLRFVVRAVERRKRVVIVNIGATRADQMSNVLILRRRAGDILPRVKATT